MASCNNIYGENKDAVYIYINRQLESFGIVPYMRSSKDIDNIKDLFAVTNSNRQKITVNIFGKNHVVGLLFQNNVNKIYQNKLNNDYYWDGSYKQ